MKKTVLVILMAAIVIVSLLLLTSCIPDKGDIWLSSVKLSGNLHANGDFTVTEIWEVEASSQSGFRNLYKVFNLHDSSFGSTSKLPRERITVRDITNSDSAINYNYDKTISGIESADDIPQGKSLVWYLDESGGAQATELGLIMPRLSYGKKIFEFTYTITQAAGMYNDSVVLYWQPFSTDFTLYIDSFEAAVQLPQKRATQGSYAWFHAQTESGFLEFKPDHYHYSAEQIAAGTMLETRILIPDSSSAFDAFDTDMPKQISEDKVSAIIAEEERFAEEWAELVAKENRRAVIDGVMAAFAVLLGVALTVFIRVYNRRIKGNYPKYIREVPDGWSAAELGHLFYYYDGGITKSSRRGSLLAATILDLARRYFIKIEPEGDGGYKIDVLDSPELKYAELKTHEKVLLGLLRSAESHFGRPFDMDDFEKFAKIEYVKVDAAIKAFQNSSLTKFKTAMFLDKLSPLLQNIAYVGMGMMALGAFIFYQGTLPIFGFGMIGGGAVLTMFRPKISRLNAAGETEYRRAHALKDYMLDFSNLKEYNVPKLVLWEEYLVYATMMGISKEVIKSLRLVYPELREIEARPNYSYFSARSFIWTYFWLSRGTFNAGSGLDIGSRFNRAFTNASNTVSRLTAPKGSGRGGFGGGGFGGGSFGGGGGGFGGGGGGAR